MTLTDKFMQGVNLTLTRFNFSQLSATLLYYNEAMRAKVTRNVTFANNSNTLGVYNLNV